jgi:hypothetical protein
MDNNNEDISVSNRLKKFISSRKFLRAFLGIVIGSIAGYLYYHFIGCSSGSCPITGNPFLSSAWGGLLGLFVLNTPCSRNKC